VAGAGFFSRGELLKTTTAPPPPIGKGMHDTFAITRAHWYGEENKRKEEEKTNIA